MAVCPKCKGAMGQTEAVCPHCGYDFPEPPKPRPVPSWVHLGFGIAAAGLGILAQYNTVAWFVLELLLLASWVSIILGVWRFLRGEE